MYIFIDGTDRTQYVVRKSISKTTSLQERVRKLSFKYFGPKPADYDIVRAFTGWPIYAATSTTVTLDTQDTCNDLFRVGDRFYIAIGLGDEEYKTITDVSISGGRPVITVAGWTNTPAVGELAGKREFEGTVIDQSSRNIVTLDNQEQSIVALSYEKIFDKKSINDTYEDKTPRYIINDFCNSFINYNSVLDSMDYNDSASLQAVWTESSDGGNPILAPTFQEGISAGRFPWTYSGGTAIFTGAVSSKNLLNFTGVSTGQPTKGVFGFWAKGTGTVSVRLGSSASDYLSFSFTPTTDWGFYDFPLASASMTGTPDWTVTDYIQVLVTETTNGTLDVDGFRILETQFFRHYPYIQNAPEFENFRVARVKPMEVMQRIADELGWFWKVDDDRYIHLFPQSTETAPIEVTGSSDNFSDLDITYDISRLINRQQVEGGDETSETYYSQLVEGDGFTREWILKNKFKGLIVRLDDNTSTDTMEATTTTTTVKATAHGLSVGDFIVNRTRSEARKVLTVPDVDSFTVDAVAGQTSGDTFSKGVDQLVGVEGLNEDAGYDFMSNFNEKSIRNAESQATLEAGQYLTFKYYQVFPIIVSRQNNSSISAMKTMLGYTDGIFDGQAQINRALKTRSEANAFARAIVDKYSNVIITAKFKTYKHGLNPGQQIRVADTSGRRNIDKYFMIQSITQTQLEWGVYRYDVTCSSLLYGMLELLQQLLRQQRKINVDEDQIINNVQDNEENVEIDEDHAILVRDSTFTWGVDADQGRWELSAWS